jgi:hypothetical protein
MSGIEEEPSSTGARPTGKAHLLRKPLWKDWITYPWTLALLVGFFKTVKDHWVPVLCEDCTSPPHVVEVDLPFLLELVIATAVATAIFMWLPAVIRRRIRQRRNDQS